MAEANSLRRRKKQRTRAAISRAALKLFTERGFEHVTLAEIAAVADVGPRTLFRYFPDKEELVFGEDAVVEARLRAALASRPPQEPAAIAVIEATMTLVGLWEDRRDEGRARQAVIAASPALRARERAKHAAHEQALVEGLTTRGSAEPAARLMARIAICCLDEAIHRWLSETDRSESLMETARRTLAELIQLTAAIESPSPTPT